MRKAALPRRPLALLAAAALHGLLAVLVVSRAPPPPAEPPILQVTLVELPRRAPPKSQPPEPAPTQPPASPDRASARTEPPLNPRRDATPAADWRVAPSDPAEAEATRATLRARLGCRTADLLALTKAERAACHDALAKGAETALAYAVVSPKLRKVFEREFECPKGDAWCEYRVGKAPYPGPFAPRKKPRDPTWDQ